MAKLTSLWHSATFCGSRSRHRCLIKVFTVPHTPSPQSSRPSWRAAVRRHFGRATFEPFSAKQTAARGQGFYYRGAEYVPHNQLGRRATALERVTPFQGGVIAGIVTVAIAALILNWRVALTVIVATLTLLYFLDLLFNLFLIYRSFTRTPEIQISRRDVAKVPVGDWPVYTILCPLYKEWEVLPQFVAALSKLDYDRNRLQVMLLLEEDDTETIARARAMKLPSFIEIVVVPHSFPKTKPKACNYGLLEARGEYIVIYDAEDVPEPYQLKRAFLAFRRAGERVGCIQGKLNFYNPQQNLLTRIFTAEYSLWFDLVLPGLQSINAPIPLGGTSNHFKTSLLREMGGWDAFNVTEDADLGMRLVKRGYRTAVMDSVTLEEANSQLANWFTQRTRWIKGYIQTYLVHTRDLGAFRGTLREPHSLTFQLVVGGKILSMFINPFMWLITVSYFAFRPVIGPAIEGLYPLPVLYMAVTALVFGNFLYLYYYMVGCARRGHYGLIKYVVTVPFYWLAMSAAAWIALYEVIRKPHYWSKTKHGLHLGKDEAINALTDKSAASTGGVR